MWSSVVVAFFNGVCVCVCANIYIATVCVRIQLLLCAAAQIIWAWAESWHCHDVLSSDCLWTVPCAAAAGTIPQGTSPTPQSPRNWNASGEVLAYVLASVCCCAVHISRSCFAWDHVGPHRGWLTCNLRAQLLANSAMQASAVQAAAVQVAAVPVSAVLVLQHTPLSQAGTGRVVDCFFIASTRPGA
jgi:hypothetical protein